MALWSFPLSIFVLRSFPFSISPPPQTSYPKYTPPKCPRAPHKAFFKHSSINWWHDMQQAPRSILLSYCRRQTTNSATQLDTSLKMTLQPVGDGAQASTERAHGHEVAPIAMPSQSGSYQSPSCSFLSA